MVLSEYVHTFGQAMAMRHGQRVHKLAIDAGFTCPNRDGTKGLAGCSFCNNHSFSPHRRHRVDVTAQLAAGRRVIAKRTRARRYLAYFQSYTNTYSDVETLRRLYDKALAEPGVVGIAVGTRPDCVPPSVLDLLAGYLERGHEVWLELGLQSAFDSTLARVNRGHGFTEYRAAVQAARARGLPVCTHLIVGLPRETADHVRISLGRVLEEGVDGLKLHPLHVVAGTRLANAWRRGEYVPWSEQDYVHTAADLVERTPRHVVFHRLTGTARPPMLLAPRWCEKKWHVLNAIEHELATRGTQQGSRVQPQTRILESHRRAGL